MKPNNKNINNAALNMNNIVNKNIINIIHFSIKFFLFKNKYIKGDTTAI